MFFRKYSNNYDIMTRRLVFYNTSCFRCNSSYKYSVFCFPESAVPSKSTNSVILTSTQVSSSRTPRVTPSSSDTNPTISTSRRSTTNPVTTISDAGSRGFNENSNGGDTGDLDEETIQEILRTITDVPEGMHTVTIQLFLISLRNDHQLTNPTYWVTITDARYNVQYTVHWVQWQFAK